MSDPPHFVSELVATLENAMDSLAEETESPHTSVDVQWKYIMERIKILKQSDNLLKVNLKKASDHFGISKTLHSVMAKIRDFSTRELELDANKKWIYKVEKVRNCPCIILYLAIQLLLICLENKNKGTSRGDHLLRKKKICLDKGIL